MKIYSHEAKCGTTMYSLREDLFEDPYGLIKSNLPRRYFYAPDNCSGGLIDDDQWVMVDIDKHKFINFRTNNYAESEASAINWLVTGKLVIE